MFHDVFNRLENLPAVQAFSESLFAYPMAQGLHVLALALSAGLLALADLRLANVLFTGYPARQVVADLRPWFLGGYALMFVTGMALFVPKATQYYASPLFITKMVLILLAGINALYFELRYRHEDKVDGAPKARVAGLVSLGLWVTVIVIGRLLAYF